MVIDYARESNIERFARRHSVACELFLSQAEDWATVKGRPYTLDYLRAFDWCYSELRKLVTVNRQLARFVAGYAANDQERFHGVAQSLAHSVCFWAEYSKYRTIYKVDPDLWNDLSNTKFPEALPIRTIRPPKMAFLLDVPIGNAEPDRYLMVYVNTLDGKSDAVSLRIAEFDNIHAFDNMRTMSDDGGTLPTFLRSIAVLGLGVAEDLDRTVGDAWSEFEGSSRVIGMDSEEAVVQMERDKAIVRGVLNVILYLQSAAEDAVTIVNGETVKLSNSDNPKKAKKKNRAAAMARHRVVSVGMDYGNSVRNWMSGLDAATGVKPHMRSAHPHLYWVGPKKVTPLVKFLAPIRVRGGVEAEGA